MVTLDDCNLAQGRCYAFCPRTLTDLDLLSQTVFGVPYPASELGTVKEVLMARAAGGDLRVSRPVRRHGQRPRQLRPANGADRYRCPHRQRRRHAAPGRAVRDEAGVLACAGSNFVASPTLATFNREAAGDAQRIGVVATPCQTLALAKMRASPLENRNNIDKLKLVVGLFCTWALRYRDFAAFLGERAPLDQVIKVRHPAAAGQRLPGLCRLHPRRHSPRRGARLHPRRPAMSAST